MFEKMVVENKKMAVAAVATAVATAASLGIACSAVLYAANHKEFLCRSSGKLWGFQIIKCTCELALSK